MIIIILHILTLRTQPPVVSMFSSGTQALHLPCSLRLDPALQL